MFLSSTLEGSETSYKEQTGADIDYKYEKGDEVKIIRYKDGNGDTVYPDDFVFRTLTEDRVTFLILNTLRYS